MRQKDLIVGQIITTGVTRARVMYVGNDVNVIRLIDSKDGASRTDTVLWCVDGWTVECQHSPITTLTDYPVDQRRIYGARFCLWCGQPIESLWDNQ